MDFARFRRKVNDSNLGQIVNGSIPGILVEGTSRGIKDSVNEFGKGIIVGGLVYCSARQFNRGKHLSAFAFGGLALLVAIASGTQVDQDPNTHYSHTSKLYRKEKNGLGNDIMVRVPLKEALIGKIAEYSPSTALALALNTAESPYRV